MRSIAVLIHLHNFGYNDRRVFADAAKLTDKNRKPGPALRSRPVIALRPPMAAGEAAGLT